VPGIDFTNDPLLQGRLFSYTDTQLIRLGGPNFHEIPINRTVAPIHNNQRDGFMRQEINRGRVSYNPNSLGGGCPMQVPQAAGGYVTFPQPTEGAKVRVRGESFFDHYSQARMFFQSQSEPEKQHIIKALRFELGKVEVPEIRERMVGHLAQIDATLATMVAKGLGIQLPKKATPPANMSVPADGTAKAHQHRDLADRDAVSSALSMTASVPGSIATRKVAILVTKEFDGAGVAAVLRALEAERALGLLVAPELGDIAADNGDVYVPEFSILTASSVLFDAVYVAGGEQAWEWLAEADAVEFVKDAYKHCKAVAASGRGVELLEEAEIGTGLRDDPEPADEATIVAEKVTRGFTQKFVAAMANHRLWTREPELHLPL
jgi:catalase